MIFNGKMKKEIKGWVKCITISIVVGLFVRMFLFNNTKVSGQSMYPTLYDNDRLFTNKLAYSLGEPKRGDIVVLDAPTEPGKRYIKRVVGISGDKIEIKDGKVYVNNNELKEKYIKKGVQTYSEQNIWEVPKGHVFVLGDNRLASEDSRMLGTVPINSIKEKASYRYFPLNRFGSLNN
ncbi:signal peptidase I [Gottschalkia purinilytica]|uniref:Signal peptidase I n=1 Tax=Gottschalkia purinilytica TaxID=1503 RepID=A0A0L0WD05_GOTPU|nr:signal peptidase I [Gottschalkia purinilytica]KNF09364.1 signal peptidase I [Gottschalkia purinilytica]